MNDDPKVKDKEISDSERQVTRDYIEKFKNTKMFYDTCTNHSMNFINKQDNIWPYGISTAQYFKK